MKLNPNCSEIVWRLNVPYTNKEKVLRALEENEEDEDKYSTSDTLSKGESVEKMMRILQDYQKQGKNIEDITIEYVDCGGGSLSWESVEEEFKEAKRRLLAKH